MKRMKKAVGIIMSVALGSSLLTGCGGSSNSASAAKEQSTNQEQQTATGNQASEDLPEITWKISHTQSPDNFMNIAAENMAKAVAEKTDGKFKIEIYHSGTLGSEQEVIEGMQMGTIAGNLASVTLLANFVPSFDVINLPGVFSSESALKEAMNSDEIMEPLKKQALDNNIIAVGYYQDYFRMLFTKEPIRTVSDFQGQKIRVMGSPVLVDTFQALGCNSTTTAWSELYSGLQLGVVDGLDHVPTSVRTMNFYDHVKYMAEPKIFASPMYLVISKPLYEKLSDAYKSVLDECMADCLTELNTVANQINEDDIKYLKTQGVEMIDIDVDAIHETIAPVREKYLKQMEPWVQDIAKKIMELK